jgi:hypothetical protein
LGQKCLEKWRENRCAGGGCEEWGMNGPRPEKAEWMVRLKSIGKGAFGGEIAGGLPLYSLYVLVLKATTTPHHIPNWQNALPY